MPVACAAASVWQLTQPALWKIFAPAAGSPFSLNAAVSGSGAAFGQGADHGHRRRRDDALGAAAGEHAEAGDSEAEKDRAAHRGETLLDGKPGARGQHAPNMAGATMEP